MYPNAALPMLLLAGLALGSCASAPRGPAGRLADAGMQATASFGSDTSALAMQVSGGGMVNAFAERMETCANAPGSCTADLSGGDPGQPPPPTDSNAAQRAKLANVIRLRAAAVAQLNGAYAAWKQEADYDARADMTGAINEAVDGTNNFARAVFALSPGGGIPAVVGKLAGFAGGLIADQRQQGRILAGNAKLREVVLAMHAALAAEEKVFARIAGIEQQKRNQVMMTLFDEGLLDGGQILKPMLDNLAIPVPPGISAKVSSSESWKTAARDVLRVQQELEQERTNARYRASLAALQALAVQHQNLAEKQNISLAEVVRLLSELNALLEKPAAPVGKP